MTSSGFIPKLNIKPIISNRRLAPYRLDSYDNLQVKLVVNHKDKLSYFNNAPVELYLNYTDVFVKYVDIVTNNFGMANISYNCKDIPKIDQCLGYVKVTVDSKEYFSNTIRFNFVEGSFVPTAEVLEIYSFELVHYSDDIVLYQ